MSPHLSAGPLRAAIVGCGDVSVVHAEALEAMTVEGVARLVAVCDTDAARLRQATAWYGVPAYDSYRELLQAGLVDVLHVTTPHDQHAEVTLDALAAGVHVLQEKPLADRLDQGRRIVAAAEDPQVVERGTKIGICYQNRYNAPVEELRRLLDESSLGRVLGAYASVVWTRTEDYYRARPWRGRWDRAGGGLLINQAIHTLDLVQWLLGDVTDVSGRATSRVFGAVSEVEDTAEAVLTHSGGTRTTFFASLTAPRHRAVELEITGEDGTATLGADGLVVTFGDGTVQRTPERVAANAGRSYWGISHELLIRDFYARLADPEPFWLSPRAALASLDIVTAIYDQSDLPGRTRTVEDR